VRSQIRDDCRCRASVILGVSGGPAGVGKAGGEGVELCCVSALYLLLLCSLGLGDHEKKRY